MKKISVCLLIVTVALSNSGCSYLTARGRQEAAYARYVRRSSAGRVKMQRKLGGFPKIPTAQPVDQSSQMTAATGPESVTASNDSQ
jgi:hypothetical protein